MKYLQILIIAFIIQGCSVFGVHQYEMPEYDVLVEDGDYELRQYKPYTVAEVEIYDDDIDEAQNRGFRILADYIFGNNIARNSERRKMRMKEGESVPLNEEISMTGPVLLDLQSQIVIRGPANVVNTITPQDMEELGVSTQRKWKIAFSLPLKYNTRTAPIPKHPAVRLRDVDVEVIVVRRFTIFVTEEKVDQLGQELVAWVQKNQEYTNNTRVKGPVRVARFDPMWTIPFLRRNEIHLLVDI